MMTTRRYPVGIQTFSEIIRGGKPHAVPQGDAGVLCAAQGFRQKLAEAATAEGFYKYTMYLIFSMLNVYVRTQVKCTGGKTDMVVWMPDTTYVFELKVNGTAQDALEQINSKNYALPFHTEGRNVIKAGIHFNKDTRTIDEWVTDQP